MYTLGLDVETTKAPILHPWQEKAKLVALGLADETGWRQTWVFHHDESSWEIDQRQMIDEIQEIISRATRLVGHNLKFDLNWIRYLGIDFDHCKLWCTQLTEYMLLGQQIGQLSLAHLSKKYLTVHKIDRVKTFWDAGYETSEIPLRILLPYLEQDCINTLAIYQRQVPLVTRENLSALVMVHNTNTGVLSEIECNGMMLDKEVALSQIKTYQEELGIADTELKLIISDLISNFDDLNYEINLNSREEVSAYLYGGMIKVPEERWVIKTLKSKPESIYRMYTDIKLVPIEGLKFATEEGMMTKKKGVFKVDKNTIKYLKAETKAQKEVKKLLVKRSGIAKALETLLGKDDAGVYNKVQSDGMVHGQYNQTIAATGRLTASDPNLQNQPREGTSQIKKCFKPRFDYILEPDLSQIEYRIAAWLSQDKVMIKELLGGEDPHTNNAIAFFKADPSSGKKFDELRTVAKIMTFRLLYGGSGYSFFMDQKMPNFPLSRWQKIVDAFYEKYQGLAKWQASNVHKVMLNDGWLVNPTGRKFKFFKGEKGYRPQQIKNYPVQSFATADVMPLAMVAIHKKFKAAKFKSLIIGQVHDALVFDVLKHELLDIARLCINEFERLPIYINRLWPGINFDMPLTGDCKYGTSWGELEKLKLN